MNRMETRLQRLEGRLTPPPEKRIMTYLWGSPEQDAELAELKSMADAEGRTLVVIRMFGPEGTGCDGKA